MKKQKKVLESGREKRKNEIRKQEDSVCPECKDTTGRSYEYRKGFGKRHTYTVYICDCGTKWEIFSHKNKIQFNKPQIQGELAAGISTIGFVIFLFGVFSIAEGYFSSGIPSMIMGLIMFCTIFIVEPY